MFKVKDKAFVMGVSELRKAIPDLVSGLKDEKIILTKKGKPIAVLYAFEKYEQQEELLDALEDIVLGHTASQREKNIPKKNYLSHDQIHHLIKNKK